jgi:transposase
VLEVEEWAEIRRLHFVGGLSVRELARRTGRGRNTIRRALRSDDAPRYVRGQGRSILDPFRDEIRRPLREEPRLPGIRVHELIAEQGYGGGKTLVYDYLAEVRPLYLPSPRTFQRTVHRPARSSNSISGSLGVSCRSAMARRAAAGWWSVRLGSRAPAR